MEKSQQDWVEHLQVLACHLNPDATIQKANRKFCQLINQSLSSVANQSFVHQCVVEEAQASVSEQLSMRLQSGMGYRAWNKDSYLHIPLKTPLGESKTLWSIDSYALKDREEGFIALGWEETHEHELDFFLNQLSSVAELTRESLMLTNASGIVLYVNEAFCQTTGYGPGEIIGRMPTRIVRPPEDTGEMQKALSAFQRGEYWDGHIQLMAKNGSPLSLSARIIPLLGESRDITHYLALANDITETRDLKQQVETLQRMEAVGTMAGGVAHRFNNILASINGHTELLKMTAGENPAVAKHTSKILAAAEKGRIVVEQLTAYSRRESGRKRAVDLAPVVRSAIQFFDSVKSHSIKIDADIPGSAPHVLADTDQIHQVLLNLLTNANEAIGQTGGVISVSMHTGIYKDKTNNLSRQGVIIEVADSGPGIPEELKERVFEPFYTTKGMAESSGMGLFVVHGIMQQHQGSITINSSEDYSTIMVLTFPLLKQKSLESTTPIPKRSELVRGTILLVEANNHNRETGLNMLQSEGYAVISCVDPGDAIRTLDASINDITLVLSSLSFKGPQTGYDLASFVRTLRPNLPFILSPQLDETVDWEIVSTNHIDKVLPKPVRSEELINAINRFHKRTKQGYSGI